MNAAHQVAYLSVDHITAWMGVGMSHPMAKSMIEEIERNTQSAIDAATELACLNWKMKVRKLVAILERVPHHGPNGSYSKAEGQCWPDCVACEYEKLSASQGGAVASAASETPGNSGAQ